MKIKLILFFLVVLLIPTARAQAAPDPNFYIYLCLGQSNMEGGGSIEEEERTVDHRFQVMADFDVPGRSWKKGEWYDAEEPETFTRWDGWFLCIAPLERPQLAMAVIVEGGGYGSKSAAPIAAALVLKARDLGYFKVANAGSQPTQSGGQRTQRPQRQPRVTASPPN